MEQSHRRDDRGSDCSCHPLELDRRRGGQRAHRAAGSLFGVRAGADGRRSGIPVAEEILRGCAIPLFGLGMASGHLRVFRLLQSLLIRTRIQLRIAY